MSWLMNLWMLGKGAPPNGTNFTDLGLDGVIGVPQEFTPKSAATTQITPFYFFRFLGQLP